MMKKLIVLIMVMLMGSMGIEIWRTVENRNNKSEITVPEIIPYGKDSIIFEEKEINERIRTVLNHQFPALEIELKENGIIEIEFEINEELNAFVNPNGNTMIKKALALFSGEKVSCEVQIKSGNEVSVNGCSAAGISIPDAVLQGTFHTINEKVQNIIQAAGIEEIEVSMDKIEIRGDIQEALQLLEK